MAQRCNAEPCVGDPASGTGCVNICLASCVTKDVGPITDAVIDPLQAVLCIEDMRTRTSAERGCHGRCLLSASATTAPVHLALARQAFWPTDGSRPFPRDERVACVARLGASVLTGYRPRRYCTYSTTSVPVGKRCRCASALRFAR